MRTPRATRPQQRSPDCCAMSPPIIPNCPSRHHYEGCVRSQHQPELFEACEFELDNGHQFSTNRDLLGADTVEKVENRKTPKISQKLIFGQVRRWDVHSANTKVRGRFSEKRGGLSHRCARNASAALENFVRHPQKTFSTVSARNRQR